MKILHVINSLAVGGAERLLADLASRQVSSGHKVVIVSLSSRKETLGKSIERVGVRLIRLGSGSIYNPILLFRLSAQFRREVPDIIHVHLFPSQLFAVFAAWLCGRRPFRMVTTEHGASNRRRSRHIFRFIDRFMYGRYDAVVAVGESAASDLRSWSRRSVMVIRNGSDLQAVTRATAIDRTELSIPMDAFLLGCVGRFEYPKDPATIIRALAKLPDRFWCAFVGDGSLLSSCKAEADRLNVSNRIRFLGTRNDVPSLLRAFDVFVLSSKSEGISLSVVEALASGVPCILTDIPTLRETAGDAAEYFPVGDSKELAQRMLDVAGKSDLAERLSASGREWARQFSIDTTATAYQSLYESLTERSDRCR